jgi:hypothetical protein
MSETDGSYQALTFDSFIESYQQKVSISNVQTATLFELTLPWLLATKNLMLNEGDELIVHCFLITPENTPQIAIAWPLIHNSLHKKTSLRSLGSFYSAITEPIFFSESAKEHFQLLLNLIDKNVVWHSMLIGPVDETDVIAQQIPKVFKQCKLFNQTENFYLDKITGFDEYYLSLPSQLRNTVKRRSKKLAATHQYNINIISTLDGFVEFFEAYKHIYQQSWKGEEFSFDFIEQVCRAAITEDKLRFGLLLIDGEPAAAQLWFLQKSNSKNKVCEKAETQVQRELLSGHNSASIFKLAYDPKYKALSVGSILSMAITEHVIENDQVTTIEFGMGSEPYKKDWLAKRRQRVSYQIFNDNCIAGKLSALRHIYLPKIKELIRRK